MLSSPFYSSYNKKYNFLRISSIRRKRSPHSPSRVCFVLQKNFHLLNQRLSRAGNRKAFLFVPTLPVWRANPCAAGRHASVRPMQLWGRKLKKIYPYVFIYLFMYVSTPTKRWAQKSTKRRGDRARGCGRGEGRPVENGKRTPRPAPRGPHPRRPGPMQNGPSSGHRLYKKGKLEYCDRVAPSELGGCRSRGLGRGPGKAACWWLGRAWQRGRKGRGRAVPRPPGFPAEGLKCSLVDAPGRAPRPCPGRKRLRYKGQGGDGPVPPAGRLAVNKGCAFRQRESGRAMRSARA